MLGGRAPRPEREPYTREAMADKVDKPKKQKSKAKQGEKGVLAALPSQRPERIGGRRGTSAPAPKTTATTETQAAKAARRKPAAKKRPRSRAPRAKAARDRCQVGRKAARDRDAPQGRRPADLRADPGRGDGRRRGRRARRRRDPARARGAHLPAPAPGQRGRARHRDRRRPRRRIRRVRPAQRRRPRVDRRAGRRRGRPARPHDRLGSAQARRQPAAAAVAAIPRSGGAAPHNSGALLICRAPSRRGAQPRRTGDPMRPPGRGGESAGSPAVALLSLREPDSSPRRHRRKPRNACTPHRHAAVDLRARRAGRSERPVDRGAPRRPSPTPGSPPPSTRSSAR